MGALAARCNWSYGGSMSSPHTADPKSVQGLPARRSALRLLDAVLRRGETLEQAATGATGGLLTSSDQAFARAIAGEALRWLVSIDALIDSATQQALAPDAKVRSVLRIMLAQWLRLDTPPHAVVATALPLLVGGPRRLAHGVFGALVRGAATLPLVPTLPASVRERWQDLPWASGAGLDKPPLLDLTLRDLGATQEWAERLSGVSLAPGHVRLPRGTEVSTLPGFADGAWWVQDFAATLPARLMGSGPGRALDMCAAPGGKTLQLASAGWQVTALDRSDKRLRRLRESLTRTGLEAQVIVGDALTWEPVERFDAVLLDAPCTATGTARRHPDVLHRVGTRQIGEMAELQARLIERAAGWLAPGGTLVYAVCSLEREEGEDQAARIPLQPRPISPEELPAGLRPAAQGWLRTDPSMLASQGGLDGFLIARFSA